MSKSASCRFPLEEGQSKSSINGAGGTRYTRPPCTAKSTKRRTLGVPYPRPKKREGEREKRGGLLDAAEDTKVLHDDTLFLTLRSGHIGPQKVGDLFFTRVLTRGWGGMDPTTAPGNSITD